MHKITAHIECMCRTDLPPGEHVLSDPTWPCPVHPDADLTVTE